MHVQLLFSALAVCLSYRSVCNNLFYIFEVFVAAIFEAQEPPQAWGLTYLAYTCKAGPQLASIDASRMGKYSVYYQIWQVLTS